MYVTKRNGERQPLDISNIRKQTVEAVEGLGLSYEEIEIKASISFIDEMSTSDIQETLIKAALNLIDVDKPGYTYAASRISIDLLKDTMALLYFP